MSFISDLHNHSRARRLIVFNTLRIVPILPRDSVLKSRGLNKVLEDAGAVIRYSLENLAEIMDPNMPQSNSDGIPSPVLDESLWRDMFHLIARNLAEMDPHFAHVKERILADMPSLNIPHIDLADVDTASSSSSSSQFSKKYDVFLSFRGEDICNNFMSHLHAALCQNKIEAYIHYKLDEKGVEMWPVLEEAIEDSKLFLIVFSENYASSTLCLDGLTKILDCSKDENRVIPVFYKIDPSHVRKQIGSFSTAFEKHELNNHKQQVNKWRAALTQAANICGWHYTDDRNEGELIREIIKCVLKRLGPIQKIQYEGLVGIHERIADVESCLCIGVQDVRFIGIWGIGGIGKTTLVASVFNKLCLAYEGSCFLENVRQETKNYGITYLKNKLFSVLLGDKESYIGMTGGGSPYVTRRLSQKKVLIILDDVDDPEQIENLAGAHSWFGPGSRVIITTRDKGVLGKKINKIYEVKGLGVGESLQLFNLNAFQDNCPDQAFADLSRKFVDYAKGIPITLKVLGSFLYNKNEEEWNNQLNKLQKLSYATIYDALELSFSGLDPEEKDIFLDIACFFKGRKVEDIKMIFDVCGYSSTIGLRSLQDKALITIFNEKVFLHDLIEEMGWKIVQQESWKDLKKRSRLWNTNDIYQVLNDDSKGNKSTKGITLDMSELEDLNVRPQIFAEMSKLKFLEFYDSKSKGCSLYLPQGLESLPSELRYLRWDNYPSKSLPLMFSAKNLVILEMRNSKLTKLWKGVKNAVNLKIIDLRNSKDLMELPDFSKALHLEEVYLSKCESLYEVHPSILSLNKLKVLELDHCASLTNLKSDIHLGSLPCLSLFGCFRLKEFSVTSENMTSLDLQGTAIKELPSSIGRMHKLKDFKLSRCRNLKNLPSNLFDSLQSLEKLWLDGCCNISEITDKICTLSSLSFLSIEGTSVERLPARIKHLSSLKSLYVSDCRSLGCLPELPSSIQEVEAVNCSSLERVHFTSLIPKMACAQFQNCVKLDVCSMKAMLASVLIHKTNADSEVIYPGWRVPRWFKYRTIHTSMTLDFSSAPHSMDWGLIFCFVLGRTDALDYKRAFFSDHVYLYRDDMICSQILERIKQMRDTSSSQILLEMGYDCDILEIKEWGVCPTYASEYEDFIYRMASKLEASASGMGVGCSDEIKDEEKTISPNHESVDSVFRLPFEASQLMKFFSSIVFFFALLELLFRIISPSSIFGFATQLITFFKYSFFFLLLLEILLRLIGLIRKFWGVTSW